MNQLEANLIHSFKLVKKDFVSVQHKMHELSQAQKQIFEAIEALRSQDARIEGQLKELSVRTILTPLTTNVQTQSTYIASRTGKKFHNANCPFGQNIKPKSKVTYETKNAALNAGLKACNCIR